ncbi:cupin domain-containing protein [Sphingobacterium kitahiroshimense]|uniref:Cupin domain-containing protein n=1 Tax=Sphingobacterium kitahiroshimense TaxID=470446 RepID=A0ABV0BZY1_9SPHI
MKQRNKNMNHFSNSRLIGSIMCFLMALSYNVKAQDAAKTSAGKVPAQVILKQLIESSGKKEQEVQMVVVTFAPGDSSKAHRHPIPTFVYVLEGEIESTFEGKVSHYRAGDAFYETPNGLHSGTKNMSKDKPAKLVAFFVGDKGVPFQVMEKH